MALAHDGDPAAADVHSLDGMIPAGDWIIELIALSFMQLWAAITGSGG